MRLFAETLSRGARQETSVLPPQPSRERDLSMRPEDRGTRRSTRTRQMNIHLTRFSGEKKNTPLR